MTKEEKDYLQGLIVRKTVIDETTGCYNWTGAFVHGNPFASGSANRRLVSRPVRAFLYEMNNPGTETRWMRFTTTCGNPKCVNPAHIEVVGKVDRLVSDETIIERFRENALLAAPQKTTADELGVSQSRVNRALKAYREKMNKE